MSLLEVKGLMVDRGDRRVLDGLDLAVGAGELVALLGGNGAGKSTALLAILGLLERRGGTVLVDGLAEAEAARERIAYLPESAALYGHLTARENLGYFLSLAGLARSAGEVDEALARVALPEAARGQRLERFSKGMRQKTAIALALLRRAPLLLLDEPTSGLDPVAIDEFHELAEELAAAGHGILMVTHDVYGACQVARRVLLLQAGRLVGTFARTGDAAISTAEVHGAFAEAARASVDVGASDAAAKAAGGV